MDPAHISNRVVDLAHELHPEYSHAQCLTWAVGFLACVVVEKNLIDNIVYQQLNQRIEELRNRLL
jgi:hypothetical protein